MVFQAYEYGDQLIALYREVAKQSVGEAVKCKMLLTRMLMGLCVRLHVAGRYPQTD